MKKPVARNLALSVSASLVIALSPIVIQPGLAQAVQKCVTNDNGDTCRNEGVSKCFPSEDDSSKPGFCWTMKGVGRLACRCLHQKPGGRGHSAGLEFGIDTGTHDRSHYESHHDTTPHQNEVPHSDSETQSPH